MTAISPFKGIVTPKHGKAKGSRILYCTALLRSQTSVSVCNHNLYGPIFVFWLSWSPEHTQTFTKYSCRSSSILIHSECPKLHWIQAIWSAVGFKTQDCFLPSVFGYSSINFYIFLTFWLRCEVVSPMCLRCIAVLKSYFRSFLLQRKLGRNSLFQSFE